MPANRNIKGVYALIEAFWDFTKIINCSIRGAILVAFCFLGGGILIIASMFVIGHNHDKNLAAEIRAQNEALAKMASQSSAHGIPLAAHYAGHGSHAHNAHAVAQPYTVYPTHSAHQAVVPANDPYTAVHTTHITPHGAPHDPYSAVHPTYPRNYLAPTQHSAYSVHDAHAAPGGYTRHGAYAAHTASQSAYPAHSGYAAQTGYPAQSAHPTASAYPAQSGAHGYASYPSYSYAQHGQPVNPIAVDPIYDSAVTRSQYHQMMQNTPMVASPYGNSINFNSAPAPISQPPAVFGSPQTPVNPAVAAAEQFAGSDAGRAEAQGSVSNTY